MGINQSKKKREEQTLARPAVVSSNFNARPFDQPIYNPPSRFNTPIINFYEPPLPAVLPKTIFEYNEHRPMPQMPLNFDI